MPLTKRDLAIVNGESSQAPRKCFQGFLKACKMRDNRTLEKVYGTGYESTNRSSPVMKTAMGESSGIIGGYLVPTEYSLQMFETLNEESFIYPRANVVSMTSLTTKCPLINTTTVQAAGTSPFFGGIVFGWYRNDMIPESAEPKFLQETLHSWDLLGYGMMSNQWLWDVGEQGEQSLIKLFSRAAAWSAEYAFLQGTGAATSLPLGMLNAPALLTVTRGTHNLIATADIANMAGKFLPRSWKYGLWATHPSTLPQIMALSTYFINDGDGVDDRVDGRCGRLMSLPLFVTDKLPALGTTGDLLLLDPSLYAIGQRSEVLIDVSEHPGFATNQTYFRIWLRLDGKPQLPQAVTLADGAQTASAYVALGYK